MKVVIAGAGGHLGQLLTRYYGGLGAQVEQISRRHGHIWDGRALGDWRHSLEGADVLINLAGRSVNCRYNEANRREILDSRIDSTNTLAEAVARADNPPKAWLNSSTATIYRHAEDHPQDEATGELGKGFSVGIAKAWEEAFFAPDLAQTRRVALRTAMVMSPGDGGPFDVLYRIARMGAGRFGNGRQRMSWVHGHDFCRAVDFLGFESDLVGPVNISAPETPTNSEFLAAIRKAAGAKLTVPIPKWAMEIAAWAMQTETELPLKSRWVKSQRLADAGFVFDYPSWPEAAAQLVAKTRKGGHAGNPP